MSYNYFADFYDLLTENVEYSRRADYICSLLSENGINGGLLLDLACGTGSMSVLLAEKGYSVIGTDLSEDMLSIAQNKKYDCKGDVMFLCQDMRSLDLYGTIDCACCNLDCINHLTDQNDVQTVFDKVSLFMNDGGIFIFDVNTLYKHREILCNNAYVYDYDDFFCAWQNSLNADNETVNINLDFFVKNKSGSYSRFSESFDEKAYQLDLIEKMLLNADFSIVGKYDELSKNPPEADSQRVVFVARRNNR